VIHTSGVRLIAMNGHLGEVRDPHHGNQHTRPAKFYVEAVTITIMSMVAASLWIELTKGTIARFFGSNSFVMLLAAITATTVAIFGLKYMFCDHSLHSEEENEDDRN